VTDLSCANDKSEHDEDEMCAAAEAASSGAESGAEDSKQSVDSDDEAEGTLSLRSGFSTANLSPVNLIRH